MRAIWVFHRGALGDSILLWPILRALSRDSTEVVLVSDASKAALAARTLGIRALDAEHDRFNALWHPESTHAPIEGVAEVLAFVGGSSSTPQWVASARLMFPGATIRAFQERVNRVEPGELARFHDPSPRCNPHGAAIFHVGAGGESKRWPLDRWLALADRFAQHGRRVELIAGEVEHERFSSTERQAFAAAHGRFIDSLDVLERTLTSAMFFIGADTGPTHLAAQLGIPTLALFGPTDPALWAPVGPAVEVIAPSPPTRDLTWLDVELVHSTAMAILARLEFQNSHHYP
jgi:ADP-heptose:LPS heptosyltransferase